MCIFAALVALFKLFCRVAAGLLTRGRTWLGFWGPIDHRSVTYCNLLKSPSRPCLASWRELQLSIIHDRWPRHGYANMIHDLWMGKTWKTHENSMYKSYVDLREKSEKTPKMHEVSHAPHKTDWMRLLLSSNFLKTWDLLTSHCLDSTQEIWCSSVDAAKLPCYNLTICLFENHNCGLQRIVLALAWGADFKDRASKKLPALPHGDGDASTHQNGMPVMHREVQVMKRSSPDWDPRLAFTPDSRVILNATILCNARECKQNKQSEQSENIQKACEIFGFCAKTQT